ncbi:eCIS core domain-containing protein [Massilia endophytica]|uniref:eCIS core domain-containing protein n=1 Tax=Massilia endophytica TaxID=2899220 RepID=UPI001E3BD6CB|nr:DUF4157 domain-containing protein [Massilia endophytica]UGQ44855.1 DUF4157 domain-containing protein [Massilia endophytica]
MLAQRKLADNIANSPRSVAQRQLGEIVQTAQESGAEGRSGLPGPLRSGIESLSGMSMSGVKVHYNSSRPAQLQAHAYAQGNDIHLGPGQEKHLPHEAWHVVQQRQGRVKATLQAKGVAINDDSALEQEADVMGARAAQAKAMPPQGRESAAPASVGQLQAAPVVQAFWLRQADTVSWIDDANRVAPLLVVNKVPEQRKVLHSKKSGKYKTKIVDVDETRRSYGFVGEKTKVYRLAGIVKVSWSVIQSLIDELGVQRVDIIYTGLDSRWGTAPGIGAIRKHSANLANLDISVFTRLFSQPSLDVSTFLNLLGVHDFDEYFQGTVAEQLKLVTGPELKAFHGLLQAESSLTYRRVLDLSPTASQGAHFLKEHGAHSTLHQTIARAVEYGMAHGNQATKGNWASNLIASRAVQWATRKMDNDVNRANNDKTRTVADLDVITPAAAAATGIFANVRANVRNAITNGPYHTGNLTGGRGAVTAAITGTYTDTPGHTHAIRGNFTGNLMGPLPGAPVVNQPVTIERLSGNGATTAAMTARTSAAGVAPPTLNGTLVANLHYTDSHVGLTIGGNHFDGVGDLRTAMDAPVNGAHATWGTTGAYTGGYINASVNQQTVNDGVGNQARLNQGDFVAGYWTSPNNHAVRGNLTGYSNGWNQPVASGGKYTNLVATLGNLPLAAAGGFEPRTLHAIVNNADVAGKTLHYVKIAGGPGPLTIDGKLLAPTVTVNGTLADLKADHLVPLAVASIASLRLTTDNIVKNNATAAPNIDTVAAPVAGTTYYKQIGADRIEFRLQALDLPPAWTETNFRVLFKLTSAHKAHYEPFTAY